MSIPSDFTENYRQSEELKTTLTHALSEADNYVCHYSERIFLQGENKNIPMPYE
jgi:hypothetical protein